MPIFNSINESLDEDELSFSQQRQLAILRKRREDRLIIPTVNSSSSKNNSNRVSLSSPSHDLITNSNKYSNSSNPSTPSHDLNSRSSSERSSFGLTSHSNNLSSPFDPRASIYDIEYCYLDKSAVELLKSMDIDLVEKTILPFLTVSDLLSLGLTSKNKLSISWTCLRIINEIHLKLFPNLLSNAMIEGQMDHVMAILMMKFSVSSSTTSDLQLTNSIGRNSTSFSNQQPTDQLRLSSTCSVDTFGINENNRKSWRLTDSAPLTSATLARRSIMISTSSADNVLSPVRDYAKKHRKVSSLDNSLISMDHSFNSQSSSVNNSFSSINQSLGSTGSNNSLMMVHDSVNQLNQFEQNACGIEPLPTDVDSNVSSFTKLMTNVKRKTRRKIFRIVVVGEKNVGKTTFIESTFGNAIPVGNDTNYIPTETMQTYCHPYYLLNGEKIDLV